MKTKKAVEFKTIMTVDEAKDTLDRTIGFVNNCDSKASIILGIIGVVFAIIFTSDSLLEFRRIVKIIVQFNNYRDVFFFILGLVSIISISTGLLFIIFSLLAKIDCNEYKENNLDLEIYSSIYFGDISKCENYEKYKERLMLLTDEKYLNDLVSQIYINSCICAKKFKRYNRGVIYSISGLAIYSLLAIIGSVVIY